MRATADAHPGQSPDSREDERSRSRCDETGEQRLAHLPAAGSARLAAVTSKRRNAAIERASEERGDRGERARQDEQLAWSVSSDSDESDRDRAEAQPQRDERRLGPEHEPETERRQSREEDPRQLDRAAPCPSRGPRGANVPRAREVGPQARRERRRRPGTRITYQPGGSLQSNHSGTTSQTKWMTSWIAVWKSAAANATGTPRTAA